MQSPPKILSTLNNLAKNYWQTLEHFMLKELFSLIGTILEKRCIFFRGTHCLTSRKNEGQKLYYKVLLFVELTNHFDSYFMIQLFKREK